MGAYSRILLPWDSQPQVGEATAAEGLGLTALILPGQSDYDLVSGIRLSSVSATPTKTVGSFGQALQLNANQESIYTTTTDAQRTAIASIVWAGTLQGTPTTAACLGGTTFNGSNGDPYVGIEIKRSATPNNLQLAYSYGASVSKYENLTSTGTYTTGNIVAVGVFESGRQSFVIKSSTGLEIRSNTRAGSISYQSTARIEIGDSLNARNPAADCALLALSNQAWTLEQAIAVANDVWGQLFAPRSIWVPVSASAPAPSPTRSIVEVKVPWDSQPQEAVGVDWNHPFFSGATKATVHVGGSVFSYRLGDADSPLNNQSGTRSVAATAQGLGTECLSTASIELAPTIAELHTVLALGYSRIRRRSSSVYVGFQYLQPGGLSFGNGVGTTSSGRRDWTWTADAREAYCVVPAAAGPSTAPTVYVGGKEVAATYSSGTATSYGWGGATDFVCAGSPFSTQSTVLYVAVNTSPSAAVLASVTANPWQLFAPRSIWVPVSSSASGTSYTISPSGGITFSGSGTEVHTKVIDVNGGVTFAGTGSMAFATTGTTYTISPSGGITFAGTGVQVRSKTIAPEGGFTFSGSGLDLRTKVIDISGGVTFGGTGSMTSNTSVVTGTVGERTKVGVGT